MILFDEKWFAIICDLNCNSFYEELMLINNEEINLFREKLKSSYGSFNDLQKFTELNNEIINMQRELQKKNAYILDLLNKKEEMLNEIEIQKNFFKQMLNAIPDLIFYKDMDSKYLGCNNAFAEKYMGLTEQEIIGKTDLDFIKDGQIASSFIEKDKEVLESGETRIYEEAIKMNNKTITEVEVLKTPFYNEKGNIIGLIGIDRDISIRKSMEKKLVKSKDAAEAANVMKSQFLANMSHEIRTPMNGILGFLDLLKMTNVSSEQEEYIREAKSASEMLLYLINDILDFSKIEAGKLSFENISFKIRTAVEDAISILVPKALEKQIELHTMIKASVPEEVIGDPGRIRQIINNLVSNAVKFTEKGEVNVTVDAIKETDGRVLLRFEVKDTGIGISEESLKKLFRPFTQADASTTRKFGGTGLGLAISKELVKLMHGDISVESELSKGCTFRFTVPMEISKESKECKVFGKLQGANILIVDDNENNRKIVRSYLEDAGCKVIEAEGADEAIILIRMNSTTEDKIKLGIIDFQMPDINGYQLAKTIKTMPFARDIKLVLLSSSAQKGDANTAKEIGFLGYLSKPVKRDELLNCVSIVLGLQKVTEVDTEIITRYTVKEEKENFKTRILLVEDNEINRKIAIKMFERRNLSCDIAMDGSEAVKALAEKDYDIVLMDCQMPVMDGYESTARIREMEGDKRHTQIIAMTANSMEGDRAKCIEAGMDDYISKPINFENMFKLIEASTRISQRRPANFDFIDNSIDIFVNTSGLSKDTAKEIFEGYIEDLPDLLEGINKAIGNNNFEEIATLAHQLKGSSGTLRINSIYELATSLESVALEKEIERCRDLLIEIQKLFY